MRDLSRDTSCLAVNGWTLREQGNLRQIVEWLSRAGVRGVAPWRQQLAAIGLDQSARLLADHGMTVTGVCRAGLFTSEGAAGAERVLDENRRAVDEAAAIGARCLVTVAGGMPPGSRDLPGAWEMVRDGLGALLPHARAAGVPLALEPLHPMYAGDRACINTLAQANDLCDALGPGLGIAVDVYHIWWDPQAEYEIKRAGKARILGFHICDWLVPTTDMLLDRGMMGDGVIDIPKFRGWVEATGYDGFCEAEIFSANNWWKRPAEEVIATCIERYQTVC